MRTSGAYRPPVPVPRAVVVGLAVVLMAGLVRPVETQEVLDRIYARVAGRPITLTDVRLARGLGLVDAAAGVSDDVAAVRQLVDRALVLSEVARLPRSNVSETALDAEVVRLQAHAGDNYDALLRATGYDRAMVRGLARENLLIAAHVQQRFGVASTTRGDARQWLDDLRARAAVQWVGPVGEPPRNLR